MKLSQHKAQSSWLIPLLMLSAVALSACAVAPPVFLDATKCSTLVPEAWYTKGVESAALPTDQSVGAWISFGIAQTGQLDKANGNTTDAISIIQKCEGLNKQAADQVQQPWWHFW